MSLEEKMSRTNKLHFRMMSFVHETLYGLFRDPYKVLKAAGLEPGQRALEVGCGPGFFTIPAARRKIEEAGVTNARVIVADAAKTKLPDGSFDLVFVFGLARPIGDMAAIWAELHRVLKVQSVLSIEGRLNPPGELFQFLDRQGRIVRFRKVG